MKRQPVRLDYFNRSPRRLLLAKPVQGGIQREFHRCHAPAVGAVIQINFAAGRRARGHLIVTRNSPA